MQDINAKIFLSIEWGLVPLIMVIILACLFIYSPEGKENGKIQKANFSGKLGGIIIFALLLLSQKNRTLVFTTTIPEYGFNYWLVLGSTVAGALINLIFNLLKDNVFVGLFTLIAIPATAIGIYTYLFIPESRSCLVFISSGLMLGLLIFSIFFPDGRLRQIKKTNPEIENESF